MDGQVGDRLIVHGRHVGGGQQVGTILEVLGGAASRYRVRWADGHETIICPGSDATIERGDAAKPWTRSVSVELRLEEDHDHCAATAAMATARGVFTGEGRADRHPADPVVPMIGEELAIARSLRMLADALEQAATGAIARHEDRAVHLLA